MHAEAFAGSVVTFALKALQQLLYGNVGNFITLLLISLPSSALMCIFGFQTSLRINVTQKCVGFFWFMFVLVARGYLAYQMESTILMVGTVMTLLSPVY